MHHPIMIFVKVGELGKKACAPCLDVPFEQEADIVLDDLVLAAWIGRLDHSEDAHFVLAIPSSSEFEF